MHPGVNSDQPAPGQRTRRESKTGTERTNEPKKNTVKMKRKFEKKRTEKKEKKNG